MNRWMISSTIRHGVCNRSSDWSITLELTSSTNLSFSYASVDFTMNFWYSVYFSQSQCCVAQVEAISIHLLEVKPCKPTTVDTVTGKNSNKSQAPGGYWIELIAFVQHFFELFAVSEEGQAADWSWGIRRYRVLCKLFPFVLSLSLSLLLPACWLDFSMASLWISLWVCSRYCCFVHGHLCSIKNIMQSSY